MMRRNAGFTLIELMIVVAIIGILAAIAIPNFLKFQLRAKAGEGRLNLAAIKTAQESYFAEVGTFEPWASTPEGEPKSQKRSWPACPSDDDDPTGYCLIGFVPEGDVYFSYAVDATGTGLANSEFLAVAQSDIDGDEAFNVWGVRMPNASGVSTVPELLGCDRVLNVSTGVAVLRQVGPCESIQNGTEIF